MWRSCRCRSTTAGQMPKKDIFCLLFLLGTSSHRYSHNNHTTLNTRSHTRICVVARGMVGIAVWRKMGVRVGYLWHGGVDVVDSCCGGVWRVVGGVCSAHHRGTHRGGELPSHACSVLQMGTSSRTLSHGLMGLQRLSHR